jgi:hypothetical protein
MTEHPHASLTLGEESHALQRRIDRLGEEAAGWAGVLTGGRGLRREQRDPIVHALTAVRDQLREEQEVAAHRIEELESALAPYRAAHDTAARALGDVDVWLEAAKDGLYG